LGKTCERLLDSFRHGMMTDTDLRTALLVVLCGSDLARTKQSQPAHQPTRNSVALTVLGMASQSTNIQSVTSWMSDAVSNPSSMRNTTRPPSSCTFTVS